MTNNRILLFLLLVLMSLFLVHVTEAESFETFDSIDNLVGKVYNGCKVISVDQGPNEVEVTCDKNGEQIVLEIYTTELTEDEIRKAFVDVLENIDEY